ncbi:hypothetical protein ONA23_01475 [Mycoplasmopsis cynos]|uniref:hypothetical protein n=1 Tax=Mycoplasmopsis cynos TaxID=171284 RepID=UPI0024C85A6D|nr:hypothetical protein [Mycoplasmopsis cynos]WAM06886.1 hypothetical protein ONA23_01475 [Mycoplasmopsis cynos]
MPSKLESSIPKIWTLSNLESLESLFALATKWSEFVQIPIFLSGLFFTNSKSSLSKKVDSSL